MHNFDLLEQIRVEMLSLSSETGNIFQKYVAITHWWRIAIVLETLCSTDRNQKDINVCSVCGQNEEIL